MPYGGGDVPGLEVLSPEEFVAVLLVGQFDLPPRDAGSRKYQTVGFGLDARVYQAQQRLAGKAPPARRSSPLRPEPALPAPLPSPEPEERYVGPTQAQLEALRLVELRVALVRDRLFPEGGKPVTLPETLPNPTEEVESVSDTHAPPQDEFQARAERAFRELEELSGEAQRRSQRVAEELGRLRMDAHQIARVFKALRLPLPDHLAILTADSVAIPGGPTKGWDRLMDGTRPLTEQMADVVTATRAEEPAREPAATPGEEPIAPPAPTERPAVPPAQTEEPPPAPTPKPDRTAQSPRPAQSGGARSAQVQGEQNREEVFAYLKEHGPLGLGEIVKALPFRQTVVSRHLRALLEEGRVGQIGKPGTKSAKWLAKDGPAVPPSPEVATEEEKRGADLLARVRDFATDLPKDQESKQFTDKMAAEALDLDRNVVKTLLDLLVDRRILRDVTVPGTAPLYEYQRPTGPNGARPRRPTPEEEARGKQSGKSGPVAGTGTGLTTGHKSTDALLRKARSAGAKTERAGNGHIAIINPANGQRVIISSTPQSDSQDKNIKRLTAIGLAVK